MNRRVVGGWLLRFVKGMFIGSGFILPGVSGGALAAVFGIYERMIAFLAHPLQNFAANLLFFLPVALGGCAGVVLFSHAISFLLASWEVQVLWCFVGCILGTLPALWKQAGRRGRGGRHLLILLFSAILSYALLRLTSGFAAGTASPGPGGWFLSGAVIGLGTIVPGLSPSNLLICFGVYGPMADAFKSLDLSAILPLAAGAAACVLALAKLMARIFARAYAGLFHAILGIVLASTAMVLPAGADYSDGVWLNCIAACIAGALVGYRMSALDDQHRPA